MESFYYNGKDKPNSVSYYNDMDSESLYKKNLKSNLKLLTQYNWENTTIEYKFNSNGFRSDEFNSSAGILYLGCSYVEGIGIPIENSFTTIVSKELNLRNYNLGQGGGSMDMSFRLASYWVPKLSIKQIVLLKPDNMRFEIYFNKSNIMFGPWAWKNNTSKLFISHPDQTGSITSPKLDQKASINTYKLWISNRINGELNSLKNELGIKYIANQYNIPILTLDARSDVPRYNKNISSSRDLARDLAHPGVKTNNQLADKILRLL